MPEQRGAAYHRQRVVEALRDEIGTMIEGELTDERIGLCYITELVMAPGGKSARIFVSAQGSDEEAEQTVTALNAARNCNLAFAVQKRDGAHFPEVKSYWIVSLVEIIGIEEIFDRLAAFEIVNEVL